MCEVTESESLERRLDSLAAENEGLRAKVARLRGRAELAERERDRLLDSYINLGTREDVRRFFGLDAEPTGETKPLIVSPEQYELGYAVPCSFPIQGGTPIRREPYRLVRRLPDGTYLVEDPSASGPAGERMGDESH